jgi:hypothetical protein
MIWKITALVVKYFIHSKCKPNDVFFFNVFCLNIDLREVKGGRERKGLENKLK